MKTRKLSINHSEPRSTASVNYTADAESPVDLETDELDESTKVVSDSGTVFTVGEIKHSNRLIKSTTPKHDLSWYIKWVSSICVLCAVTFRASGIPELHTWDVLLSWVGAVGWFVVGFLWKDRALVLLNGVIGITLFAGLLKILFGG